MKAFDKIAHDPAVVEVGFRRIILAILGCLTALILILRASALGLAAIFEVLRYAGARPKYTPLMRGGGFTRHRWTWLIVKGSIAKGSV